MNATGKTKQQLMDEIADLKKEIRRLKTEKRKLLKAAEAVPSDRSYQIVFNALPDAVAIHDLKGHFLDVNDTLCERLGVDREELLRMTPMDIDTAEHAGLFKKRIDVLRRKGKLVFETAHACLDGRIMSAEVCSRTIDFNGTNAVLSVARDISERKKYEQSLRESEERFRSIIERSDAGYFFIDGNGLFQDVNEAWLRMHKYDSPEEVIGRHFSVTQVPEDLERAQKIVQRLLEGEEFSSGDFSRLCKDGSIGHHLFSAVPVIRGSQTVGMEGFLIDVTEQRKMEKLLRESEELYRIVMESISDPIFVTDDDGIFTFICGNVRHTLGYTIEEVQAMENISGLVGDDLFDKDVLEQKKEISNIEKRIVDRNGEGRIFLITVKKISVGNGTMLYCLRDITGSKQASAALRESEERFRRLVEFAPEAIFVQTEGRFAYLNEEMRKLLGASTTTDLLGKEFMNYTAPEYHEIIRERIRIQRETRRPVPPMEQEYLRVDGSRIPVETAAVSIRFQGRDSHVVFVRDISERRRAAELLEESEEKYRLLFHGLRDAVYVHEVYPDKPGRFIAVNEAACRMLGYAEEELLGMTVKDIDVPEQAEKIPSIHEKLFGHGYALFETWHVAKDGRRIPVESNIQLFELQGKSMVLSVVRDITERRKVEDALKESEDRYSTMVNASPNVVLVHKDGIIRYMNEYGLRIVGYGEDELIGRSMFDFLTPDSMEIAVKNMKRRMAGECVETYEVKVVMKSKVVRDFLVSAAVIPYEGERAFLVVLADVTERKKAEEMLVSKVYELERVNSLFVGRETRMIEMKAEVNGLLERLGEPRKYSTPDEANGGDWYETSE